MIFRAKRLDTGEFVEGDFIDLDRHDSADLEGMAAIHTHTPYSCRHNVDPATLQQKIGDHWLTPGQVEGLVCCGNCRYGPEEAYCSFPERKTDTNLECWDDDDVAYPNWQPRVTTESEKP